MSIIIFFLSFLYILSLTDQNFHGHNHHHSHHFPPFHPPKPNCDHMSRLQTKGYLVFKVSLKGCGNFTTVQDAVDAIPTSNRNRKLILVDSGIYRERVIVPEDKTNIVMRGMGYLTTSIEWNNTAASSNGTFSSFSVAIFGEKFTGYNLSFKNTAPAPYPGEKDKQAVALRVAGDKAAFYGCGFYGNQDTLHDHKGRHFYKECFIQGSIDFIFGNARSLYQDCTINSVAMENTVGCITANGRESQTNQTGFVFVNCRIKGRPKVLLGRAWRPYATVIFSRTYMSRVVYLAGWNDMGHPTSQRTVYFGENRCYGPGANHSGRVPYGKQLPDDEAAPFTSISFIDGEEWL